MRTRLCVALLLISVAGCSSATNSDATALKEAQLEAAVKQAEMDAVKLEMIAEKAARLAAERKLLAAELQAESDAEWAEFEKAKHEALVTLQQHGHLFTEEEKQSLAAKVDEKRQSFEEADRRREVRLTKWIRDNESDLDAEFKRQQIEFETSKAKVQALSDLLRQTVRP